MTPEEELRAGLDLTEEERAVVLAAVKERREPFVSIDPAMRWGQPVVNGTRLPVQAVVDAVWAGGIEWAMEDYDLSRGDVLVA